MKHSRVLVAVVSALTFALAIFPTEGCIQSYAQGPTTVLAVSMVPLDDATGVPLSTTVSAAFDGAMTASTINETTFKVTTGGTLVAGSISYDAGTHRATFTPTSALAPLTTYVVGMAGMKDASGVLVAEKSWSFKTGS